MPYPELKHFKIKKKKRAGLFYTLYEATDKNNESRVFLKLLNQKFTREEKTVLSFLGSAQIVKRLNHPNICKIYSSGKDREFYYIASERIDWESLSALILEKFSLSFHDLTQILTEIGVTLRYAHLHGLVHGFLNPQSIFIDSNGSIKIDEFGFSSFIPNFLKGKDKKALELVQYIAPEYYQGVEKVDGRADIYSLGMILVHLLAGKPPFSGKSVAEIQNQHLYGELPPIDMYELDLPYELQGFIEQTTSKYRDKRFQNLKALLNTLDNLRQETYDDGVASETVPDKQDVSTLGLNISDTDKYFSDEPEGPPANLLSRWLSKVTVSFKKGTSFLTAKKVVFASISILVLLAVFLLAANKISNPFANKPKDKTLLTGNHLQEPLGVTNEPIPHEQSLKEPEEEANKQSPILEKKSEPQPSNDGLADHFAKENQKTQPMVKEVTQDESLVKTKEPVVKKPEPLSSTTMRLLVKAENEPTEAEVFLGETRLGKTNEDGALTLPKLDMGKDYTVRVSKEGYESVTKKITAATEVSPIEFDLQLNPALMGTLMLDAVPNADSVFIDGVLQTDTLPMKVNLKGGEHRVRFVNTNLKARHEQSVSLKSGEVMRLKHDFTKNEYGKVGVSLKNAAQYGFGFVFVDGKLWQGGHNTTPVELRLPVGPHTIAVKRDGFNSLPQDIIVNIEKDEIKYVAFTFSKVE